MDEEELDLAVRSLLMNLMIVLYDQGITEIHMGGLMRLLGVSDEVASTHDDERIIVDENFAKYVRTFNESRPEDQPLH